MPEPLSAKTDADPVAPDPLSTPVMAPRAADTAGGPVTASSSVAVPPVALATTHAASNLARGAQGWLSSLVMHMLVLIALAVQSRPVTQPDPGKQLVIAEPGEALDVLEEAEELSVDPVSLDTPNESFESQPTTDIISDEPSFSPFDDATEAPSFAQLSDFGVVGALEGKPSDIMGFSGTGTSGRGRMSRAQIATRGGTMATESSVTSSLGWIAEHQNPDGTWSLVHDGNECQGRCANPALITDQKDAFTASLRAGTGLALLPYLGAGQTHKVGKYRQVVRRGLEALVRLGEREDIGASWSDPGIAAPYSHAIAAIALTEAYGMTDDSFLAGPAQAAVDYIAYTQAADGGWRYKPKAIGDNPNGVGDTSVTGWQIMALKSAFLAKLNVPPVTTRGASAFLDKAQRDGGAQYVYVPEPQQNPSNARSSIGLLCRMYLGWPREHEALVRGMQRLSDAGPSSDDYYYNYYATQALFQHTGGKGALWRKWNTAMRQQLISQQDKSGHAKGSWWTPGPHNDRGGRLYMTSLATMTLEVYYRYMPIYQTDAVDLEFPE